MSCFVRLTVLNPKIFSLQWSKTERNSTSSLKKLEAENVWHFFFRSFIWQMKISGKSLCQVEFVAVTITLTSKCKSLSRVFLTFQHALHLVKIPQKAICLAVWRSVTPADVRAERQLFSQLQNHYVPMEQLVFLKPEIHLWMSKYRHSLQMTRVYIFFGFYKCISDEMNGFFSVMKRHKESF